jgi:hypothetical protein
MTMVAAAGSLFGRERELAHIHRLLERSATGPAALVLEGEPGIGKTTSGGLLGGVRSRSPSCSFRTSAGRPMPGRSGWLRSICCVCSPRSGR